MDLNYYLHFTTETFVEDDFFRRWVLAPDTETIAFWQKFQRTYPEKSEELAIAKQLLLGIHQQYEQTVQAIPLEQAKSSFQQINNQLKPKGKVIQIGRRRLIALVAAACVTFLVGTATWLHFQTKDSQLTFTTGNGQRLPVDLPDGSKVQLNANSTLSYYPKNWWDKKARHVWLEGEAFFKVEKKAFGTKFIVHAGEMQVAVLGTQFNVRSRGEDAVVVLEEGKVELAIEEQKITMQPGDLVSYSATKRKVATKKVKPSDYVAWKDGITIFNDRLSEVVKELEILYGIPFTIKNKELEDRIIQLSAPTNSLEQVLETLELLYPEEISTEQKDGKVIIF